MKAKTVKAILAKKFNDFLKSIEDEELRKLIEKNTIITGGCIASMLLGEDVNDFDIYFRNKQTALAVAAYYVKRFNVKNRAGIPCEIYVFDELQAETNQGRIKIIVKSSGIASEEGTDTAYEYFEGAPRNTEQYVGEVMQDPGEIDEVYERTEKAALETTDSDLDAGPKYRPVFMSTNAITLSNKIQIILRFYGSPEEIHANYDFVHCTNHYTTWDEKLDLKTAALEALLARELRYVGSRYPICSLIRVRKFIKRGWVINAGQMLKMVMQISELNLKDVKVLEDQLTGVDVAYFAQVISSLKEKDPEKVNASYLVEILDRMF